MIEGNGPDRAGRRDAAGTVGSLGGADSARSRWCLWASSELKRMDDFASMSDEELRQYVYGNKESDR